MADRYLPEEDDNGYKAALDLEDIQSQREQASRTGNIANVGNAFANMVNSRGEQGNAAFFNGMRENAKNNMDDAEAERREKIRNWTMAQQEKENKSKNLLHDPNSEQSKAVRNAYRAMYGDVVAGIENFDNLSAQDINDNLSKPMELKNAADARAQAAKDAAAIRAQDAANARAYRDELSKKREQDHQDAVDSRAEHEANADFERLTDKVSQTRGNQNLRQEKQKLNTARHGLALLSGDLDKLTPEQVNEVGGILATQVSNGNAPAMQTLHEMTPQSASKDMAKALSYITGKPAPSNQGEMMKMYREMLQRQMDTSQQIIADEYSPIVKGYGHLRKKDKERFDSTMSSAGIKVDDDGNVLAYEPKRMPTFSEAPSPHGGGSGTAMAATAPAEVVVIQAPDGSTMKVPKSSAEKYIKKGGKVVP